MSLKVLSDAQVSEEKSVLPVTLTNNPSDSITTSVVVRSGDDVAYGSFELEKGFAATLQAKEHLFVLVLNRSVRVKNSKANHLISAGNSFILPVGASVELTCGDGASALFSTCRDANAPSGAQLMRVYLETERNQSPPYSKELLLAGDPRQSGKPVFTDSSGRWKVGMWDSTAYRRKAIPFPKNELMCFHCGSASFDNENGKVIYCDRNEPFIVEKGFFSDWNSETYVFKTYCTDMF